MSKVLCSFSGKNGDILWSLPTVREISRLTGGPVDFKIMPYYENLLPLLEYQPYIEHAAVIPDWLRTHSNHGDGPWEPPKSAEEGYEKVYHLTYRAHPGIGAAAMPLIDFIAYQQGIRFAEKPIPFLDAPDTSPENNEVTFSFNDQYADQKEAFLSKLRSMFDPAITLFDPSHLPWLEAAAHIKHAVMHVGCRSAMWVVAVGLGKLTLTYEPHPARNAHGHLGKIFGCPYAEEFTAPFTLPPEACAEMAAKLISATVSTLTKERSMTA